MSNELVIIGFIIFLIPFIIGLLFINQHIEEPNECRGLDIHVYTTTHAVEEKEVIKKEKEKPKTAFKETKSMLKDMGFTVEEIKTMFKTVEYTDDVSLLVKQCLEQVKV